jgi:hypothetical protein
MKKILLILLFFNFQNIFSQTITGKILDKQENPIVYATIQITVDFGVITNEEGAFEIETENFKPTDKVIISFLGFKQKVFDLKDFESKNYYLEEEINTLNAIFVTGEKLSIKEIMKKVKENTSANYKHNFIKQQIFHRTTNSSNMKKFDFSFEKSNLIKKRELKKLNLSLDSIFEKMVNKTFKNYTDALSNYSVGEKTTKLDVIKRTILINKKEDKSTDKIMETVLNIFSNHLEKGETYKVKSGLFKVQDSMDVEKDIKQDYKNEYTTKYLKSNYNTIFENNSVIDDSKLNFIFKTNKYHYDLKNTSYLNGDLVYIIDFKPKKSGAKFKGVMYVNSDDFAVVKTKFYLAEGKISKKLNLKLVLGMKVIENIWKSEILFQKNNDGKYYFKFIKQEVGGYAYISRPLKFTKNRKSKSEEKKLLKMRFLIEMNQLKKDELFFINTNQISADSYSKITEKEKYKVDYIPKYNPKIWKGYNVLSPVQEIKDYVTGE